MKPEAPTVVAVRAIDVGYFSTKYSLGRRMAGASAVISTNLFPSLVPVSKTGGNKPKSVLQKQPDGAEIDVNGVKYYVGSDVVTSTSGREPRPVLTNYCLTDPYLALIRGALHYIARDAGAEKELVIKNLILGLPLNTLASHAEPLSSRVTGEHLLPAADGGDGMRRVTIEKVTVIAQPQGALAHYGVRNHAVFNDSWSLVIDAGGGTLDWYVANGRTPVWNQSGAYPKSMLACAHAVVDRINPAWKTSYVIMDRIDKAIRTRADSFTTAGETYKLADHWPSIEKVLKESIDQMEASIEEMDSLDVILFTGGGAPVFYDYMARRYPKLAKIMHIDTDPVFSNVKGFHLVGEVIAAPIAR